MDSNYGFLNGFLRNDTLHKITLHSGENESLIDINNKKYIDLNSGLWNVSLGYNNELNSNIRNAFSDILMRNMPYIDMTSYSHNLYEKVAKKLLDFSQIKNFEKVIFTNSGSESLEAAIKIVNTLKDNGKIVSFSNSYHGTFYGNMSISGLTKTLNDSNNTNFDNTILFDFPESQLEEDAFFEKLRHHGDNIVGIFVEPVIGSGGIFFREISFYNKLIYWCRKLNILTIFDEVATGFYKSGSRFFTNKLELAPDIICLSKSINNGTLPAGAVLLNKNITERLKKTKIKHMSTQNGNLLAISSINETLDFYYKYDDFLLENVKSITEITKKICSENNIEVRAIGSMIAIPINKIDIESLVKSLKLSGIIVYRHVTETHNGLTLFPPININIKLYEKTLKYIIKKVKKYECI
ncbi:hypothetical protein BU090_09210 [Staphylococcus warneri]|uniref:aminotransferase class III-fold pyridoxal phosphate-dependent enzyme n=1 Tax=Staphylococcus warneri TaxID=1292 RepID=UPI000D1D239F|nr:aminotransferase class III-fold pyridoxal phosphate-dependent enzyme [Staphylococcus warneri]PTI59908.1 hypothetical protein BU090_09210 [Staphylococcus warneri]